MARKISFVLIVSLLIGINLFFSCTPVDDNDHTPPTIKVLSPSHDTLIYVYRETDTVFPRFKAEFTDDTALSSYTFRIRHGQDSINALVPEDTTRAYFYKNYQSVSIFDTIRMTVTQTFRIDSLMPVTRRGTSKSYPIYEGLYYLDAFVVDMQGNQTRSDSIPIYIKYKSSQ